MAMQKHTVRASVWAYYYKGRFSSFHVNKSDVAMDSQEGWIRVRDAEIIVEFDTEANQAPVLAAQIDAEIALIRANAEAAVTSKIAERNNLLCLEA